MSSSWMPGADFGVNTGGVFGGGGAPDYSGIFGGGSASSNPGWGTLGSSVGRIAGGVLDIFRTGAGTVGTGALNAEFIKESTKELKDEQNRYLGQIQDTFGRIAGLSGKTVPDAVNDYINLFKDYADTAYAQGRQDLEADQALGGQYYDRLKDAIALSQGYSLLRNPVYEQAYKTPDAVAPVDVSSIKDVMTLDASDPEQFKKFSFSQPESQALIQGRPDAISQYANFFASKPSQDLMKYTV